MSSISVVTFSNIKAATNESLSRGTYIVLTNVNKVPPHISLLCESLLYTLTIKGYKLDIPLELHMKSINLKRTPTLFIKVKTNITVHNNQVFISPRKHMVLYERVDIGIATCLSPIKNFFADLHNLDSGKINFVYDLVSELQDKNLIEEISELYMSNIISNGKFHMKKYSMQDIYESIYKSEIHS